MVGKKYDIKGGEMMDLHDIYPCEGRIPYLVAILLLLLFKILAGLDRGGPGTFALFRRHPA